LRANLTSCPKLADERAQTEESGSIPRAAAEAHLDIPYREARELLNAWRAVQSRTGTLTMVLVGK